MKKSYVVLFLILVFSNIFTFFAFSQLVQVTSDYANIRPVPDTDSIIIGEAYKDNIFEYAGKEGDWIMVNMFSGEYRYIHQSLVEVIEDEMSICFPTEVVRELMEKIKKTEERSIRVSKHNNLVVNPESKENRIDFQKILLDRYALEVFQEFFLQPASYRNILLEFNKEKQSNIKKINTDKKDVDPNIDDIGYWTDFDDLSEEVKKEIYLEMIYYEDLADVEAMQCYFPGFEDCEKFIEADIDKYIAKFSELSSEYKEKLKEKYHINEEVLQKISDEAAEKDWEKSVRSLVTGFTR